MNQAPTRKALREKPHKKKQIPYIIRKKELSRFPLEFDKSTNISGNGACPHFSTRNSIHNNKVGLMNQAPTRKTHNKTKALH